jgi:hypothetical protein
MTITGYFQLAGIFKLSEKAVERISLIFHICEIRDSFMGPVSDEQVSTQRLATRVSIF